MLRRRCREIRQTGVVVVAGVRERLKGGTWRHWGNWDGGFLQLELLRGIWCLECRIRRDRKRYGVHRLYLFPLEYSIPVDRI